MAAIGLARVTDTDQLIGGQMSIKLAITKSDQYGEGNEVKAYKSMTGGAIPAAIPAVSVAPKATTSAAPPWAKK